jgi:UDPglucose 6-dehydrogenase
MSKVKLLHYGVFLLKPQTDDMREAPSLYIVKHLLEAGAIVKAYDPIKEAKHHFGDTILYCEDQYETH